MFIWLFKIVLIAFHILAAFRLPISLDPDVLCLCVLKLSRKSAKMEICRTAAGWQAVWLCTIILPKSGKGERKKWKREKEERLLIPPLSFFSGSSAVT